MYSKFCITVSTTISLVPFKEMDLRDRNARTLSKEDQGLCNDQKELLKVIDMIYEGESSWLGVKV